MALPKLYPGKANSAPTFLRESIDAHQTNIDVLDASRLPQAENLATIGTGEDAETIKIMAITGNTLTVTRGFQGVAKAWDAGTIVARYFTEYDYAALKEWVEDSSKRLDELGADRVSVDTSQYPAGGVLKPEHDTAEKALNEISVAAGGFQIVDRLYPGVDLSTVFADEIAANPYNGDVWAWIKARIQAANFSGIHVGDFIPFVAGGNTVKAEIAGMDTYYQYGDTVVPHHIDFISRDCWPVIHVYNRANYNNGTTVSPSPWLASDLYAWLNSLAMQVPNATTANPALVAVNYGTTGVYDKLPAALKAVIVPKRLLLPSRYTAGSLLTSDSGWAWVNVGNLWIPSEVEVYGMEHLGSKSGYSSGGFQQYPIFAQNMHRVKGAGDGGDRTGWWLSSASGNNSTICASVGAGGNAGFAYASGTANRVPICFRIA